MFQKGRSLGFIWDPQIYFSKHCFTTVIIIEGHHERGVYLYPKATGLLQPQPRRPQPTLVLVALYLVGHLRCFKHHVCVCAGGFWTTTFSASYRTSNGYIFLPVSHHTCTSTAISLLICQICTLYVENCLKKELRF